MGQLTQWHGEEFLDHVQQGYSERGDLAAEALATKMREKLGTDFPPASEPGEAPHRRTGDLQASVKVVKPGPLTWYIGADTRYALALELGRDQPPMAARPFMLETLMENTSLLYQILVEGDDARQNIAPFAGSFAPGFAPGALFG